MSRFLNSRLQSLAAYVPGEQPRDKTYIKLNTNESPYPPPEGVIQAVGRTEMEDLRLYSDPACTNLRQALAESYRIPVENVFLANGSDEILNFAFMAYGSKGVAYPDITYGFYSVFADLYGLSAEVIPLRSDFSIDPSAYYGKNALVVIANPNAPTGLTLSLEEIEHIVTANPDGIVLIDEAYVDFGAKSACHLTEKYSNLLVVQTFSKSRSMAGARLGFAFGDPALIQDLEKIRYSTNPYNLNRLTQLAGTAALGEADYFKQNCRKIMKTRSAVKQALEALGFTVTDSLANFLFAKSNRISGEELYRKLKEKGILIRHFSTARIQEYNRITIGSPEEMDHFLRAVKTILEEGQCEKQK